MNFAEVAELVPGAGIDNNDGIGEAVIHWASWKTLQRLLRGRESHIGPE